MTSGCLFDGPDLAPVVLPNRHRDGETYSVPLDCIRLNRQARAVFEVMRRGGWWSLAELEQATNGEPQASVSARLRDFRKLRWTVDRRRRGMDGTWEYRLRLPGEECEG